MGLFCCFSLVSCLRNVSTGQHFRVSVLCRNFSIFSSSVGKKFQIISLTHICVEKLFKPIWESLEVLSWLEKYLDSTEECYFQVMKDSQLFLVVGVLLTIDITIMTTWHLADPFYREIQQLKSYVSIETFCSNDNYSL